mmetsp:Transcript_1672/g.2648  ORF Transcript_1672/g.2648 Transcript_1672/m.2648 type:complete len:444 (-) Transcript_1672:126-1457(-)
MEQIDNLETLSYRELQKVAKEYGVPANAKKDTLLSSLQDLLKEKATSECATAAAADVTEEVDCPENESTEEIDETDMSESVVEAPAMDQPEDDSALENTSTEECSSGNDIALDTLTYRELQKLAKEYGISAKVKKDALLKSLESVITVENKPVERQEFASPTEGDVVVESTTETFEVTEAEAEIQAVSLKETEIEVEECVNDSIEATETDVDAEEEVNEVGNDHQVECRQEFVNSTTEAFQASEVEAAIQAISLEETEVAVEDSIKDGIEATESDVDAEEEANEVEEDLQERVGGKLLGVATPCGVKKLFNSPAVSQSGNKLYEKYNPHWRYEDYENANPQMFTPAKAPEDDQEWFLESDSTPRNPGEKLRGYPTPVGKSIYFTTPNKTAEKKYEKYNPHWRYEDYDSPCKVTSPPHISAATAGTVSPPAQRERKYSFVHVHP